MSIMKRPVVAIAAMLVISVAAMADNEDTAARGATLLQPFKQDLKQALVTGLQQGPEVAISVAVLSIIIVFVSTLLSMRRVLVVDPATVFRG